MSPVFKVVFPNILKKEIFSVHLNLILYFSYDFNPDKTLVHSSLSKGKLKTAQYIPTYLQNQL